MKTTCLVTVLSLLLLVPDASGSIIRVIDAGVSSSPSVQAAINHLNALGHSVDAGGTLSDYSAYEQVWDLRFNADRTGADSTAFGDFLAGGGSLYISGETGGGTSSPTTESDANTSVVQVVENVGGGTLVLDDDVATQHSQFITIDGQKVNSPNFFTDVDFDLAGTTSSAGDGFLVTETSGGSGRGSLIGWDYGDIDDAPNSRMLVGFDIEIFDNGQNWTENMETYLSGNEVVPEPSTYLTFAGLITCFALAGWRRKRKQRCVE